MLFASNVATGNISAGVYVVIFSIAAIVILISIIIGIISKRNKK